MLVGAVVHSIIVSEMINVVTSIDEQDLDKDSKKELVTEFCRHSRIKGKFMEKMNLLLSKVSGYHPGPFSA